jgi:F-type H+-transporting ATPase subunit gamma
MAASLKDLRKKIKSITSTKKITQAMQMVAASKMQKAINRAQLLRNYSYLAWEVIKNIAARTDIAKHRLLIKKEQEKNILLILITSNKGLCGSLNAQILRKISSYIKEKQASNINVNIITMGNKGRNFISRYYKDKLIADFPMPDRLVEFVDITPLTKIVFDEYGNNKYDRVCIFYNQFVSSLLQKPIRRQILPIPDLNELEEYQVTGRSEQNIADEPKKIISNSEYKFEPDTSQVLDLILPKIIQSQIFQIILEASASEHSARMVSMKNATDNAEDLIDDLQLTYNSMRQAAITQGLSEITAGAEALRV